MKLSNRQKQLLEILVQRRDGLTAAELAEQVGISTRTVHRELEQLEFVLSGSSVTLVRKAGSGLMLQAEAEQLAQLRVTLDEVTTTTVAPSIRKYLVLLFLIQETEPIKLFSLAHEYDVAVPTITNDLDELEHYVSPFGITIVRRRGYGVELTGSELAYRRLLFDLASQFLDESDFFDLRNISSVSPLSDQLLKLINKDTFYQVLQALAHLESVKPTLLSETSYTQLMVRLSIAVTRAKENQWLIDYPEHEHELLPLFMQVMKIELPLADQHYIAHLFAAWDDHEHQAIIEKSTLPLLNVAFRLTRLVEEKVSFTLSRDDSLIEGMQLHLEPALERILKGEKIRNPLLLQIKKDFSTLYEAVESSAVEVWPDLRIPDEEIGFLVMHFGAAIERAKLLTEPVRAIIVCTSGIGSSKLLSVRIQKELPQIKLVGHVSWYEATRMEPQQFDLIISTVELPMDPARYIRISPLLLPAELERLRQFIMLLHPTRSANTTLAAPVNDSLVMKGNASERLTWMRDYVEQSIAIIERLDVHELIIESERLEYLFLKLCAIASTKIDIANVPHVAKKLLEREQYGSQRIPQSSLALLHTRSSSVSVPIIHVHRLLNTSIMRDESDPEDNGVNTIVLMLAPEQLDHATLTVLSEFSALLLQPIMIEHLQSSDDDSLRMYVAGHLESRMKTSMKENER